ncbi:hypothetical protein [Mycobacterium sp.]|uniref:hypothetical protein n=1 Tax=Mycobacterium sp. TaxID=1785 RepID=UPI002D017A56|nr:hypothetical protein [Mycobacterium sp.]HTQ22969.1 hypothetical protein [Mycobacterium sp.]
MIPHDIVWPTLSVLTMTVNAAGKTIDKSRSRTLGVPMSANDPSAQLDKISEKARRASEKLKAAGNRTKDRLQADVVSARGRASAAADRLNDKAVDARSKAASQWREIRAKWDTSVAKGKAAGKDRAEPAEG